MKTKKKKKSGLRNAPLIYFTSTPNKWKQEYPVNINYFFLLYQHYYQLWKFLILKLFNKRMNRYEIWRKIFPLLKMFLICQNSRAYTKFKKCFDVLLFQSCRLNSFRITHLRFVRGVINATRLKMVKYGNQKENKIVQKARSQKPRCRQGHASSVTYKGESFLASSLLVVFQQSLTFLGLKAAVRSLPVSLHGVLSLCVSVSSYGHLPSKIVSSYRNINHIGLRASYTLVTSSLSNLTNYFLNKPISK